MAGERKMRERGAGREMERERKKERESQRGPESVFQSYQHQKHEALGEKEIYHR